MMTDPGMEQCLDVVRTYPIPVIDLTEGAPRCTPTSGGSLRRALHSDAGHL